MASPGTSLLGRTLGHYRILEQIGAGGMGVVYRARDERLGRDVALKVLPAGSMADDSARKRFRQEAHALSRLNHPNIETVHDVDAQDGVDFLVIEHIVGTSLAEILRAGPLSTKDLVNVGQQLAEAIATAHRAGVLHRDIKPANLRLTADRRLKVLDFGLARVSPVGEDTADLVTRPGTIAGTLPYMAPEQLSGGSVDERTDIWAIGCVLYELATGSSPFLRDTTQKTATAIFSEVVTLPVNSSLHPDIQRLVLKCLEKDREDRYQNAKEIAVDLRRLASSPASSAKADAKTSLRRVAIPTAAAVLVLLASLAWYFHSSLVAKEKVGAATAIRSIVVLPFANLSGDPQQEYFADGMTDALISELTKIRSLKVISRTSAMQYKGVKKPIHDIAGELGVEGVIEGSVIREGQKVRISVQLIEASNERSVWAERYDRDMTSILALQGEVANEVAARAKAELTPQEKVDLARNRAVNPEAYEVYLRGRAHLDSINRADIARSAEEFQRAISIDPQFALAYAWLVEARYQDRLFVVDHESRQGLRNLALKSLELDDSLAEGHIALAKSAALNDWATQEREFKRALELKPGYVPALSAYASYYLSYVGRHDEAIAMLRRTVELEPGSPQVRGRLGRRLFFARRYEEAIEQFKIMLDLNPDDTYTRANLGRVYLFSGRMEVGVAEIEKSGNEEYLALAYAMAGKRKAALQVLQKNKSLWTRTNPANIAVVYAALGEKDEAFRWLDQAFRIEDTYLIMLKVHPVFDPLRSDPRFQVLLRRMNFPA